MKETGIQKNISQRSARAMKSKSTTLNLSQLGIQEFPQEVLELTHITSLYLGGNHITDLPDGLSKLENMERLSLSGNKITDFPTVVSKLPKLFKLRVFKHFAQLQVVAVTMALSHPTHQQVTQTVGR